MQKIDGWDNIQAPREFEPLPLGAYVMRVMKAEFVTGTGYEALDISLDVAEGEYKDYYANDYRAQTGDNKRWRGVLRLFLPKCDGSEKDEWTKSRLKGAIAAIEASNNGYKWAWDESTLKGKTVGCLYRNEEWSYNGKTGWNARPFRLTESAKVREGNFKLPKDKPLPGAKKSVDVIADDLPDDLPF